MAQAKKTPDIMQELVDQSSLKFDFENPRFIDRNFRNEDEVIRYLYDSADVDELIQSIMSAGYIDFDPLIVLQSKRTVLEGNRRLVVRIGGASLPKDELLDGLSYSLEEGLEDFRVRLIDGGQTTEIKNRQTNAFRPGTTSKRFEHDFTFVLS